MYLEYSEYQDFGGQLQKAQFLDLEYEAETVLDWHTFNRLHNQTTYPLQVKRCMYALINLAQKQQEYLTPANASADVTGNITAQSNDGVSISYNVISAADAFTLCQEEVNKKINHYLQCVTNNVGKKLLYRGVYPDE